MAKRRKRSKPKPKETPVTKEMEPITRRDILDAMSHDGYKRRNGAVIQKNWAK